MPTVCAIISCPKGFASATTCLRSLNKLTRKPDFTLILSDEILSDEKKKNIIHEYKRTHLIIPDSKQVTDWETAFSYAFKYLCADYIWILDAECGVTATALEVLADAAEHPHCIPVSLLTDSVSSKKLSHPVITESGQSRFAPWKSVLFKRDLPDSPRIPLREAWMGALYPRSAYAQLGSPKKALTVNNNNEEYAWKAKLAGFRFILLRESTILHPPFSAQLLHYRIGGRSFFYEPGLPPEQRYYKIRNWAWIQRLRKPGKPFLRLIFCGLYIILALNAMLKSNELNIRNTYNLFRALHNGFYGKLRPYSSVKN